MEELLTKWLSFLSLLSLANPLKDNVLESIPSQTDLHVVLYSKKEEGVELPNLALRLRPTTIFTFSNNYITEESGRLRTYATAYFIFFNPTSVWAVGEVL